MGYLVWESLSLPFLYSWCPSLLGTVPWVWLALDCLSVLHTLFIVASFQHLAVESVFCHSSGHFLDYLHWCGCYLVETLGGGEPELSYSTIFPGCPENIILSILTVSSLIRLTYLALINFVERTELAGLCAFWAPLMQLTGIQDTGMVFQISSSGLDPSY